MRWDQSSASEVESPKVNEFLKEIDDVCRKHGLSISHEDFHGGFVIEKYHRDFADWLQQASIGHTVPNGQSTQ